jgi:ABC-type multidrug transport system permease subunit
MWWGIGFGGLLYVVVLLTLGIRTLKRGHGWMFFFGIFLPLFWLIGAFIGPTERAAAAYR